MSKAMGKVISKSSVQRPVLRAETIDCAALGGAVIIQQMTLQLYLDTIRYGMAHDNTAPISKVLALCVVDADRAPIFDEDEWEAWSPGHLATVFDLYAKIKALSGVDVEEAAKN